jgi:hypothetical protein
MFMKSSAELGRVLDEVSFKAGWLSVAASKFDTR